VVASASGYRTGRAVPLVTARILLGREDEAPGGEGSCAVGGGVGERAVVQVIIVPPVHLHPLPLKQTDASAELVGTARPVS
jgi:hypothetical protein